MTQPVFESTATALREKSKLQRHFRRFDVFFYLICTVVTIDTIGARTGPRRWPPTTAEVPAFWAGSRPGSALRSR